MFRFYPLLKESWKMLVSLLFAQINSKRCCILMLLSAMLTGIACYSVTAIEKLIDNFEKVAYTREGAVGQVYVGEVRHQMAAIKVIPKV